MAAAFEFHRDFSLTIDGRGVPGTGLAVIDPSLEQVIADAPDATRAQLDEAVASAARAQRDWARRPWAERSQAVRRIGELLVQHRDAFARLLTTEQGKPLAAAQAEVGRAAHWCLETAAFTLPDTVLDTDPERRVVVRHVPLGVVGAIVPWNFPMTLALWKVAPALLAGNTVVLKPSPFTPLTALKLGELLRDELPPGVLNVVSGGDALGPWMSSHPGIAKIAFTGSTATGRRVMESAAADLKRITLELGGNDAALVLPDVDPVELAPQIYWACFANSGQYCLASKRVYIHDSVYDALAAEVRRYGETVRIGPGLHDGMQIGPVQNRPQFERVLGLFDDCRREGLRFVLGGDAAAAPRPGYFVPPTVVDNPPEDSRIVVEEPFGPIVPFLRYADIDDAIARANASPYGLGGSVWGRDVERAHAVADRLDAGMIWVNEIHRMTPHAPLAGHKQSGMGSENGIEGLAAYTNTQVRSTKR